MNNTLHHSQVIRSHEIAGVRAFLEATKHLIVAHGWCPSSQVTEDKETLDLQKALLTVDFGADFDGVTTEILYVKTRNFLHTLLGVESLLGFDQRSGNSQNNVIAFLDYALYMLEKKGIDDAYNDN